MTIETSSKEGSGDAERFASRETFLNHFSGFIDDLTLAEEVLDLSQPEEKRRFVGMMNSRIESLSDVFSKGTGEKELFERVFTLFSLKHSLSSFSDLPETASFLRERGFQERLIEMGGQLAVSKTVLAEFLVAQIGAELLSERFGLQANPFCEPSYDNPDLLLRAQLGFFLLSIFAGLDIKTRQGRGVRDSSTWSDIYVFMEWKHQLGLVGQEEYEVYMKLVDLLDPLIARPDLLVMLIANSSERLYEGLQARIEAEPEVRQMERLITEKDLKIQIEATKNAVEILKEKGVNVLAIEVDPVEIYHRPELRYASVYGIRESLGILGELLSRDPEEVADEIVHRIFAPSKEGQVVVVHSPSMFSGKTVVANRVAEMVGRERVVAFQPNAAIRYGEEQLNYVMDRDGGMIEAMMIESNRLKDIIKVIDDGGITPEEKPFIIIDEMMLFVESRSEEAIETIKELRSRGFNVVLNGVDYTFKEEPFTFMHELIGEALVNENWHQITMETRCKYCKRPARGTARLKREGGDGEFVLADFKDEKFQAGDEEYEPVCCVEHKSCKGQPDDFMRQPLPTEAA